MDMSKDKKKRTSKADKLLKKVLGRRFAFHGSQVDLELGEVFIRSAVFDPVRGYAYFGQDSRPNQGSKFSWRKLIHSR